MLLDLNFLPAVFMRETSFPSVLEAGVWSHGHLSERVYSVPGGHTQSCWSDLQGNKAMKTGGLGPSFQPGSLPAHV